VLALLERWHDASGVEVGGALSPAEVVGVAVGESRIHACAATLGLVTANRSDRTVTSVLPQLGAGAHCQHVVIDGDRAVVSHRGNQPSPSPFVSVIDVSNPSAPTIVASEIFEEGSPEGIAVIAPGTYAVASHDAGVRILRLDGGALEPLGALGGFENAWALAIDQHRLYVGDGADVATVDVSSPEAPVLLSRVALSGSIRELVVGDGLLFAAAGGAGLHVLDLLRPDEPRLLATYDTPGSAVSAAYASGHVFLADWNDARVVDVREPCEPRLAGTESTRPDGLSRVLAVAAGDGEVVVGDWRSLGVYGFVPDREAPDVRAASSALQFPTTAPGEESARSLVLHNEGQRPLSITSIQTIAPFVPLVGSLTIAPGSSDFVEIRFQPQSASPAAAEVVLMTNDPDEPVVKVAMTGNDPALGVGDPIPDWTFLDLATGAEIRTTQLAGSVLLLSYFATF
jgi:hypothetical protein